ncbi:hypothetical protein [Brytella acorum]|uniref:Uncharacterized protein n=1 Tax=Brytella acorum TaxID=2959299 RepID=A0AA35UXZ8_9PROT|nr:hypothetical protein [Brytella acorum]MDF3625753.1 hypothetical protein [Brytella acorum]CAI9121656.1 hypothetical protein LMG32879_002505 [Brytella acorum]
MKYVRLLPFVSVLALAACDVPTLEQKKVLDSMVGRTDVDVIRQFGVPTRAYQAGGHNFLAYIQNETQYSPGSNWGWGWGGGGGPWGWGGGYGGWGGWGGGYGGWGGGMGMGMPSTYYNTTCQTTFELVDSRVIGWTMRGDGC